MFAQTLLLNPQRWFGSKIACVLVLRNRRPRMSEPSDHHRVLWILPGFQKEGSSLPAHRDEPSVRFAIRPVRSWLTRELNTSSQDACS